MNTLQLYPDSEPVTLREPLVRFAIEMELKLRKNDHKDGWHRQPIEAHVRLLKIEMAEFDVAREFFGPDAQVSELVDIANYALIIRDKLRNNSPPSLNIQVPGV